MQAHNAETLSHSINPASGETIAAWPMADAAGPVGLIRFLELSLAAEQTYEAALAAEPGLLFEDHLEPLLLSGDLSRKAGEGDRAAVEGATPFGCWIDQPRLRSCSGRGRRATPTSRMKPWPT